MLRYFSGVSETSGNDTSTEPFNKLVSNVEYLKDLIGHHGAAIAANYKPNSPRTFSGATYWQIPYEVKIYDTDGFWNPSSPDHFTIPAGFTKFEAWSFVRVNLTNWMNVIYRPTPKLSPSTPQVYREYFGGNNNYFMSSFKSCQFGALTGEQVTGKIYVNTAGTYTFDSAPFNSFYSGSLATEAAGNPGAVLVLRAWK